ncbi:MAG TPA: hypothetical protein VLX90_15950 [Steroidobacteraceae bacterium]|nr:hypothetical protein [Steroidobacteraceae bacterium]
MNFGKWTLLTTGVVAGVLPIALRVAAQNTNPEVINFAVTGDGTFPASSNKAGAVTGRYTDGHGVYHGFLRSPAGEFITFDAPGAGKTAGSGGGTFPESINDAGAITGHYTDSTNVNHGFLRNPAGGLITVDAPGADNSPGSAWGTFPRSINTSGAITGSFTDGTGTYHGFLRNPGGEFLTFDAPGVEPTPGSGSGTLPAAINDAGVITGRYVDSKNVSHAFVRGASGAFSTFDAPGAGRTSGSGWGTFPRSINNAGTITGHFIDSGNVNHGFVRDPSGRLAAFDAPGESTAASSGDGTFPQSIDQAGAVAGYYTDRQGWYRGFLRSPVGEFTTFDAPGAGRTAGIGCGTFPASISSGAIAGHYTVGHSLYHGFLRGPGGEFIRLDAPGAGMRADSGCGTFP